MNLIHSLGLGYAFLSGKERELGLIHSLSSLLWFGGSAIRTHIHTCMCVCVYISNHGFGLSFKNGWRISKNVY